MEKAAFSLSSLPAISLSLSLPALYIPYVLSPPHFIRANTVYLLLTHTVSALSASLESIVFLHTPLSLPTANDSSLLFSKKHPIRSRRSPHNSLPLPPISSSSFHLFHTANGFFILLPFLVFLFTLYISHLPHTLPFILLIILTFYTSHRPYLLPLLPLHPALTLFHPIPYFLSILIPFLHFSVIFHFFCFIQIWRISYFFLIILSIYHYISSIFSYSFS